LTIDDLAALIRALALAALFQAAGGALFMGYFGERLGLAAQPIGRLVRAAAIAGFLLIAAHGCIETARLGGTYADAWEPDLLTLFLTTRGGMVHAVQMGAMAIVAVCAAGRSRVQRLLTALGSFSAAAAFAGSGHTSIHALRTVLAPMLIFHVTVGACWFGSLAPLLLVMRDETAQSAVVFNGFSRIAGLAVPLLGIAGLTTAVILVSLIPDWVRPYGLLLIAKTILFLALLILASYNRWKYVPAMIAGSRTAAIALRRSIGWEMALIIAVLAATSVLTTFFSPQS
jgi:putative copper resistance protein D